MFLKTYYNTETIISQDMVHGSLYICLILNSF